MDMDWVKELDTPCIVVDVDKMKRNIKNMQDTADSYGCALRPHVKTHKSVELARMQLAAGAAGVTCAKTSEAETFADGGVEDIFIAYPLIGETKLRRALRIKHKTKRFIMAVDCLQGARAASAFALSENAAFETRIEIDTGAARTGASLQKLTELANEIRNLKGLNLTGVYTYKGLVLNQTPTIDKDAAGAEEGALISQAVTILRGLGFDIRDVSAGSTPTGASVAKSGGATEIRPGTYIFHDLHTMASGVCSEDDIAAYVYATVVNTREPGLAVLDAGSKTLAADVRLNARPFPFAGFAKVAGRDELILDRVNEEHGMIRAINGETGLNVGDVLALMPSHICPVINLQNYFYLLENGDLRKITVDARGMVR